MLHNLWTPASRRKPGAKQEQTDLQVEGAAQSGSSLSNHTAGPIVETALQVLADAAGSGAKSVPDEATEVSTERKEGSMAHQQVGGCGCLGPCPAAGSAPHWGY